MSKKNRNLPIDPDEMRDGMKKGAKGIKKLFQEFKDFAMRGNMIDMAVGIVIGSAFTALVNSLVKDTFMPFVTLIIGGNAGEEFEGLAWNGIKYGETISAIINFIILAAVVFLVVKAMNALSNMSKRNQDKEEEIIAATELSVLQDIKKLLEEQQKKE